MAEKEIKITEQVEKSLISPQDAENELWKLFYEAEGLIYEAIAEAEAKGNSTAYLEGILATVKHEFEKLSLNTEGWINKVLPESYQAGIHAANEFINTEYIDHKKPPPAGTEPLGYPPQFSVMHREALRVLVNQTQVKLSETIYQAGRHTVDRIRKVGREAVEMKIVTGSTVRQTKEMLLKEFKKESIDAIPMKNGRYMSMAAYAKLVARTTTREASNLGNVTQVLQVGGDLVKMTSHFPTCPICLALQGRVYSITGENENYPRINMAWAKGYSTVHPNCRHVFVPYIIELKDDDQIQEDQDYSNRPWDIDDWAEDEKKKAEASLAAYQKDQARKAQLYRDRQEWRDMRAQFPDETPTTLSGYRRTKQAKGPVWKNLQIVKKQKERFFEEARKPYILVDKNDGRIRGFDIYRDASSYMRRLNKKFPDRYRPGGKKNLAIYTIEEYLVETAINLPIGKKIIDDLPLEYDTAEQTTKTKEQLEQTAKEAILEANVKAIVQGAAAPPITPFGGFEITRLVYHLGELYRKEQAQFQALQDWKAELEKKGQGAEDRLAWIEEWEKRKNILPYKSPEFTPHDVADRDEGIRIAKEKYGLTVSFADMGLREINDTLDALEGLKQLFNQVPQVDDIMNLETWQDKYIRPGEDRFSGGVMGVCTKESSNGGFYQPWNALGITNYIGTKYKDENGNEIEITDELMFQEMLDKLKYQSQHLSTSGYNHVPTHELGHALVNDIIFRDPDAVSKDKLQKLEILYRRLTTNSFIFRDPGDVAKLSSYGLSNLDEMAAECIAELVCGEAADGDEPREAAMTFYRILTGSDLEEEELDRLIENSRKIYEEYQEEIKGADKEEARRQEMIKETTLERLKQEMLIEKARGEAAEMAAQSGRHSIFDKDYIKGFVPSKSDQYQSVENYIERSDAYQATLDRDDNRDLYDYDSRFKRDVSHYVTFGKHNDSIIDYGMQGRVEEIVANLDRITTTAPRVQQDTIMYDSMTWGADLSDSIFDNDEALDFILENKQMTNYDKGQRLKGIMQGAIYTNNTYGDLSLGYYDNSDATILLDVYVPAGTNPGVLVDSSIDGFTKPTVIAPRGRQYQIIDVEVQPNPLSPDTSQVKLKVMIVN